MTVPSLSLGRLGLQCALLLAVAGGIACASSQGWLPYVIASAPNRERTIYPADDLRAERLAKLGISRQLRIAVGPPAASLSIWVLEPSTTPLQRCGATGPTTQTSTSGDVLYPTATWPRATILMLHGVRDEKSSLLPSARRLARAGYRAVLVDSRGHGRSSGEWLTYGVQESRDLAQVLEVLDREGLVTEPLGVFGNSYGAATAIQFAACEPRVRAVVAVAPFCEMTTEVEHYVRGLWGLRPWAISDKELARSIAKAGKLAGFDPRTADVHTAIQQTSAAVLLIHGRKDRQVPFADSERLHAAAPDHSELLALRWDGHVSVALDPTGAVGNATTGWFGRWLATADTTKETRR